MTTNLAPAPAPHASSALRVLTLLAPLLALSACVGSRGVEEVLATAAVDAKDQTCLARAMYFESNRSSEEGMLAVGTVVMNRVESPAYPSDVCGVVGQPRQFAPGVMTREMNAGRELAMATAEKVLRGARHPKVREAKFFHTAGYSFGYPNMHYVAIAGGNAFYEKIGKALRSQARLASQADVAAGKESFDFAALRTGDREDAAPTSALALDTAASDKPKSPFLQLFGNLNDKRASAPPARPAAAATGAGDPDPARFGDDLPGVAGMTGAN